MDRVIKIKCAGCRDTIELFVSQYGKRLECGSCKALIDWGVYPAVAVKVKEWKAEDAEAERVEQEKASARRTAEKKRASAENLEREHRGAEARNRIAQKPRPIESTRVEKLDQQEPRVVIAMAPFGPTKSTPNIGRCRHCHQPASRDADKCPHCGCPKPIKRFGLLWVAAAIIVVSILTIWALGPNDAPISSPTASAKTPARTSPKASTASPPVAIDKAARLEVKILKKYMASKSHAAFDILFRNTSGKHLNHWGVTIEVNGSEGYLGVGEAMASSLKAGDEKIERVILSDTRATDITGWRVRLSAVVCESGLRCDEDFELVVVP